MKRRIQMVLVTGTVSVLILLSLLIRDRLVGSAETPSTIVSFGVVKPQVQRKAPSFCLKTLDGKQLLLEDLRGKPILLKFWATWCPSCMEELPMMEQFAQERKDELVILMIAIDGEKEKKIQRVAREKRVTLPVLLDPKAKTARAYGVSMIPASFLIDREGQIVGTIVGERDWVSPKAWLAVKEVLELH